MNLNQFETHININLAYKICKDPHPLVLATNSLDYWIEIISSYTRTTAIGSTVVAWPSGLRRWFKAPVSSEARVRIPPLPEIFARELSGLLSIK